MPHLVDVCAETLAVDPIALERYLESTCELAGSHAVNRTTGRPIRALIVMHTFGHPAAMHPLCELASRWNLVLLEDAAESLGTTLGFRHTGLFGRLGTLSFNGNKIVTTGGGGAIVTADPDVAARARHLCTTARLSAGWDFVHDQVGYNYRMPSINAALGLAQLERLPDLLARKRALAERYRRAFAGIAGVRLFVPVAPDQSNHWLNTLILDSGDSDERDRVLSKLNDDGIAARPAWTPMHQLPMYAACPRMPLPVTERLWRSIINLPSSPSLAP
jgi:perosamine synthetase